MPDVKILVNDVNATLDAATNVPAAAIRTTDPNTGMLTITINTGNFGVFDPVAEGLVGPGGANLISLSCSRRAGNFAVNSSWSVGYPGYGVGGFLGLGIGLRLGGLFLAVDSKGNPINGLACEGFCMPIPVDHKIVFLDSGPGSGGYIIQMSIFPVAKVRRTCLGELDEAALKVLNPQPPAV